MRDVAPLAFLAALAAASEPEPRPEPPPPVEVFALRVSGGG